MALDPMIDRGEAWLLRRLHQITKVDLWGRINAGVTDQTTRRDRIADFILEHRLSGVIAGKNQRGVVESFEEVFARIYGQPLGTTETHYAPREAQR